jgi:hypothetical protein
MVGLHVFFYGFKTCQVVVLYMVRAALTTITKVINQPTTPEGRMDFKLNRIYVVGFLRFGLRLRSLGRFKCKKPRF